MKKSHDRSGASDQRIDERPQSANAPKSPTQTDARPRQHRPRQRPQNDAPSTHPAADDRRPHPEEPPLAEHERRGEQNAERGEDHVAAAPHAATLPRLAAYKTLTWVSLQVHPGWEYSSYRAPPGSPHAKAPPLLTVLLAILVASCQPASAATCWKELVNDYWADNRVDRTYPITCYREAMEKLPRDVQEYSDAQDDLRRALLLAIRDERDSGGGYQRRDRQTEPTPQVDDNASQGFFPQVIDKIGPKNADSIPVPLLVLGSIALLLLGAAAVSYITRYIQARRMDVPEPRP